MEKELKEIIEKGENERVEFKPSLSQLKEIVHSVCAMANSKGGIILIGISNSGEVLGIEIGKQTIEQLTNKIVDNTGHHIYPEISVDETDNKNIIVIRIKEGKQKPYTAFGRAYLRVGKNNKLISKSEYDKTVLEAKEYSFDSEICEEAVFGDLNEWVVKEFLKKARYGRRLEIDEGMPITEALEKLGLLIKGKLTNAAILLFGKNPQRFFAQAEVRCARFKGIESIEFTDMKVFGGNIIEQAEKSLSFVLEHIPLKIEIKEKPEREEKYEYPPNAIREAIINAICHRNYSIASNVQIRILDDRIEVWGVGKLPQPLTLDDLKKKHNSVLRNPLIGKCFFLIKFIEQWGTGTNRIIEACLNQGLPEPIFEEVGENLVVTLRKYKISEEVLQELSNEELSIIKYIREKQKITRREGIELLKVSKSSVFRYFKRLEKRELIKKSGKGKNVYYKLA